MPPVVRQQTIPPLGMASGLVIQPLGLTVRAIALRQGSEHSQEMRPRYFKCGKSSGCHELVSHPAPKWDVDRCLKNGCSPFIGGIDPEATLMWFDDTKFVLEHIGCPPQLWVRVTGGAIRGQGWIWWRFVLSSFFGSYCTKKIAWEEFSEVFYNQYFFAIVIEEKKIESMALKKRDMIVAEYLTRFLALQRFALGTFHSERQRATKFVRGLHLSLQLAMSMFHCAMLEEVVVRVLEGEATHCIHHMKLSHDQSTKLQFKQKHRGKGQDQQAASQRYQTDDAMTVHTIQAQRSSKCPDSR